MLLDLARMSLPSWPERPTAVPPWLLMRPTMSELTLPTSTMPATSRVAASVTRWPSTKTGSMPRRLIWRVISRPPPCTITGRMPTSLSSTTSLANCSANCGEVMAAPPYLTTMVEPWKRRM